jgi:hypothetical protein
MNDITYNAHLDGYNNLDRWTGAAHLKSLKEYPPCHAADTLSLHKALESAMAKLDNPKGGNN